MSTELCYKACVANYILNKCNCVSIRVDLFLGDMLNENVTYCLHIDPSKLESNVKNALCEKSRNSDPMLVQNCSCNWPCYEVEYDVSTLQIKWPQKSVIPDFIETYVDNSNKSYITQYILQQVRNYLSK